MKTVKLMSLALLAMLSVAAQAQAPQSGLTRAEVLADLHIWHLSGLEELKRRSWGVLDTTSEDYLVAKAKYDAMRASSEFPALVAKLERNPFSQIRAR